MFSLFGLLLVPLIVGGIAYSINKRTVTWKEFLLQIAVSIIFVVGTWSYARYAAMQSTEHWNGRVTAKDSGTEHCCHSYECNCSTCSNSDGTTYSCNCSTCYRHSIDYWWAVDVSTGDKVSDTCVGHGSDPRWWSRAYVGEPVSIPHEYTNYLKADPESIMVHDFDPAMVESVPPFPEVHSRMRVRKVVRHGDAHPPLAWDVALKELNADIGRMHQVDVTILVTSHKSPTFAFAVEAAWLYGPKNSLNIVMGTDGEKITWARVVTISDVEELKIELRDGLQGMSLRDPNIIPFIRKLVEQKFRRTPMAKYEYLASAASPEGWWLFFLYFFAFLISGGLAYWVHVKDVFGDERWILRSKNR